MSIAFYAAAIYVLWRGQVEHGLLLAILGAILGTREDILDRLNRPDDKR